MNKKQIIKFSCFILCLVILIVGTSLFTAKITNLKGSDFMKNYYSPNDSQYLAATDAKSIQNAIDNAIKDGVNRVVIPSYNERTSSYIWEIDETILLPDNITLTLDGCHLVLAEGVFCNMFRNKNAYTDLGKTLDGEQRNIRILGINRPVLDGGVYNGHNEHNTTGGQMINNCFIVFSNVRDFEVSGLKLYHQRYWSMAYYFCRYGKITDLEMEADWASKDKDGNRLEVIPDVFDDLYVFNGDGVDIRTGCNNILIDNINGRTQDDSVALTALKGKNETDFYVEGKDYDIYNVTVKNVRTEVYCWAAQVRLLNTGGAKIHDVIIDTVIDTIDPSLPIRNGSCLLVGDLRGVYDKAGPQKMGDMYNISIKNISSGGVAAIRLANCIENLLIENVYTKNDTNYAIYCPYDVTLKNAVIKDIFVGNDSNIDGILSFSEHCHGKVTIDGIYANAVHHTLVNGGDIEVELKNVNVETHFRSEISNLYETPYGSDLYMKRYGYTFK